ncbi:MAG: MBL fold metallo-hydrolase [Pseudomonadota bacterium]
MRTHITILFDNEARVAGLQTGWGFSCLILRGEHSLLFDTGWDGLQILENARRLGIDLAGVRHVFLSHAHWDHAGGLPQVLSALARPRVYVPASISRRLQAELARRAEVVAIKEPRRLLPGMHTTGELGEDTKEQSLVVELEQGAALLTGCAHPGLDAILAHAARGHEIKVVIGGFHGFDRIEDLAGLELVVPCHCTVHAAAILARWPGVARAGGVGACFGL